MASRSAGGSNAVASKLLIVESPAKIKTLSKFLGTDFKIMSTYGHIKDLPKRVLGITFGEKDGAIHLEYVPIEGKESAIAAICKSASRSEEIYLASDPDREGEIISWHIAQEINKARTNKTNIFRITFNEITKPAVIAAIQNKTSVDEDKVAAQQARRVLDRWVGYEVSPILWKKISKGLSAGRVQSVALLLVCDRENEIVKFVPVESWSIHGLFGLDGEKFDAELWKIGSKLVKLKDKTGADEILKALNGVSFSVDKIVDKKRASKPLPSFMTSSLQQDAYNKLGFSVDRTMKIAQRLYEGLKLGSGDPEALITYMRTDSLRISDTALKDVRSFIKDQLGDKYLPLKSQNYAKKGAQDAHEAVRPISVTRLPKQVAKFIGSDEAKLYELIWKRFVACQMTPAVYAQRQVQIKGDKFIFKATGSTLIFDGFLKVYEIEEDKKDTVDMIPSGVAEGVQLDLKKLDGKQHFTKPPARYTEASLVKELEKKGVGRPSTYATTLATIQKRGYVDKDKRKFVPTELGRAVINLLTEHLADIINVNFTARMEESLDKIAQGKVERDKVLLSFYEKFRKDLETFGEAVPGKTSVETSVKCPKCGKPLHIRFGKAGKFLGCSGFPDCDFTSNFERNEKDEIKMVETKAPEAVDMKCPKCGKHMVKRIGRFGPFIACSGYPECKYIHAETLKMKCPDCGGNIRKRVWRKGTIWGCENYPKCKFGIFGDVVEKPCPKCKKPYMMLVKDRDGSVKHVCSDKECGYSAEVDAPADA